MKKTIIMALLLALVVTGCSLPKKKKVLTIEEAKAKTLEFINTSLMQPGNEAEIKEITEEGDLYKLKVMANNQEIESYLSKDGEKFFPQVMIIADIMKQVEEQKNAQTGAPETQPVAEAPKADNVSVELFVMSHCPYGTQIEKGILPVVKALGDKIDFKLKFCDYAMHGEKELKEQMNQYCIDKNEPAKLLAYLECFLEADDSAGCLKKASIDQAKLDACVAATDKEFKVMEGFNDKSTWLNGNFPKFDVFKSDVTKYGVQGSPSLVINGAKVNSGRDAASLLKSICSGFNNPPAECNSQLSSDTPAPGFGSGTAASGAAGGCAN